MDKGILILAFFEVQTQIKLYHWQTKQYSRHISTDKYVEKISELIDTFVEVFQGKYGRIMLGSKNSLRLENLSDANASNYLISFKKFLEKDLPKFIQTEDTDLFNIRDEMLALTNQTIYLFTLN